MHYAVSQLVVGLCCNFCHVAGVCLILIHYLILLNYNFVLVIKFGVEMS